ncbi:MAG: TIGR02206 family membrane protein [Solirubrobacteraceae bacterium]
MRQFSQAHLAALAVMVIGVAGSVSAARRHPGPWTETFARALALVILAGWAGEYVADALHGTWSIRYTLPLQLTDLISLAAILALWTRAQWLVELAYYWSFTASLQATLTPDLQTSFPHILYFTYFTYHVGAIVASAFLVFGLEIYPRRGAVWRAFGATLAWAMVAGLADVITGGNYMYLAWKPTHASLLSVLGPWPWYIGGAAAVGLVMMLIVEQITNRIVSATACAKTG